ncbi:hypothetical protein D9758_008196 [Tetrapyrgos nigripes]|uniref:F-box domain-containing protein n=1 Tax=Tetrapyrgos nigripes TaxID=182062 RepID=A0A8H5G1I2_9AGAR|nr:hypothetical protein D9758_008196 [Tetrapyrgos nigripes]
MVLKDSSVELRNDSGPAHLSDNMPSRTAPGIVHPLPRSLTDLIPLEIYEEILSQLSSSPLTLNSCCLVCKAWIPASRYWLFSASKVLVLRTNVDAFLRLVNRRDDPFSIIPFIQHLALEQGGSHRLPFWGVHGDYYAFQFDDFLKRFHGFASLKSLRLGWIRADIGSPVPVALRSNFSTVNELELNSVVLSSVQQFFDILHSLPNLVVLSLSGLSFEYEIVDGRTYNSSLESTPAPPALRVLKANVKESVTHFLFSWLSYHKMRSLETVAFGLFSERTNEILSRFLRESSPFVKAIKIWDAYTAAGIDLSPCVHLEVVRLGWICLLLQIAPGSVRFATEVLQTVTSPLKEIMIVIRLEKGGNDELEAFDWAGLALVLQKPCFRGLETSKLSVSGYKDAVEQVAKERLSALPEKVVEVIQWTMEESAGRW